MPEFLVRVEAFDHISVRRVGAESLEAAREEALRRVRFRLEVKPVGAASTTERIREGSLCGTCADDGETSCECWQSVG